MDMISPPSSDNEQVNQIQENTQNELQGMKEGVEFFKNNMNVPKDIHANSFRNLMANQETSEFRNFNTEFQEIGNFSGQNGMRKSGFGDREDMERGMRTAPINGFEPASMVRKVDIAQKISDLDNFQRNIKWGNQ